jgi:hypothetical protein
MRHPTFRPATPRGSALVLVLAALLLLTTLVVAFLSRVTFERQQAASSSGLGKSDLAAQGAIAMIIGNLQSEIIAGSGGSGTPTLSYGYYPTTPTTAVPCLVVPNYTSSTIVGSGLEDLVKISYGQTPTPFYSGTGYSSPGPTNASAINTLNNPSLNGRSISLARWNKPLFMAKATPTSSTDLTPVNGSGTGFTAPDWVYVAHDGSTPITWDANSSYTFNGTNAVTQRYAYAIYDEGSTLDVNVAGSPVYSTSTVSLSYTTNASYKNALAYADLSQLPYLSTNSQTVAGGTSPAFTTAGEALFIDALVGWRNYASASNLATNSSYYITATGTATSTGNASTNVAGTFPGTGPVPVVAYTFPGAIAKGSGLSPYDVSVSMNPLGFMGVSGGALITPSTPRGGSSNPIQSDNAFVSRQQLISFLTQGLGQNQYFPSSSYANLSLANLQNLLPYLGTFSRDISQPSYASPASFSSSTAPTTLSIANGGNDKGGGTADAVINPAFLAATVTTGGWSRNDGTLALTGEPLVKKRFALSRLAWLTYLGPIADDHGYLNNNSSSSLYTAANAPAFTTLINLLESYGLSASFLSEGGPTNIYKYFGLSWVTDTRSNNGNTIGDGQSKWVYNHENTTYLTSLPSGAALIPIRTLSTGSNTVLAKNREADFFELIKAATTLGSVGKAYLQVPTAGSPNLPANYLSMPYSIEATRDNSADLQILQMGANIIDQFQPSSYCARILFSDGITFYSAGLYQTVYTAPPLQEIRGIVDLPYIYRMREGKITIQDCAVTNSGNVYNQAALPVSPATNSVTAANQGLVAVLQEPEIWNPHSWNTNNPDINPRPSSFRMVAYSTDPNTASSTYPATTSTTNIVGPTLVCNVNNAAILQLSCPSTNVTSGVWNENTTELDFNIPYKTNNAYQNYNLFREPTLLIKPGVPTGSNLAIGPNHLIKTLLNTTVTGSVTNTTLAPGGTGGNATYIHSHWPATQLYSNYSYSSNTDNQQYIGFLGGVGPAAWYATNFPANGISSGNPPAATNAIVEVCAEQEQQSLPITYRLQYNAGTTGSPVWVTYDEKPADYICASAYGPALEQERRTFIPGSNNPLIPYPGAADNIIGAEAGEACIDPRTSRFGMIPVGPWGTDIYYSAQSAQTGGQALEFPITVVFGPGYGAPPYGITEAIGWAASTGIVLPADNANWPGDGVTGTTGHAFSGAISQLALTSMRPDWCGGFTSCNFSYLLSINQLEGGLDAGPNAPGWYPGSPTASVLTNAPYYSAQTTLLGMMEQNNPAEVTQVANRQHLCYDSQPETPNANNQYFADPDGVVRRAMGAYVPISSANPAVANVAGQPSGLPMDIGTDYSNATNATGGPMPIAAEQASRPIMLNRPFRSVGDLDYVFSGTPWRNLDVGTPESGSKALLDVFCVNDTYDPNGLVAGKVNLNTRQAPVLAAVLAGAYRDEFNPGSTNTMSAAYAQALANSLVARTGSSLTGQGPLANVSELAGKWNSLVTTNSGTVTNGGLSYVGFSSDPANTNDMTTAQTNAGITDTNDGGDVRVERFRNAPIRALANAGTTRVWNLMIDVIAQTGRFPSSATGLANFNVEGERRYWVHVALDRYTGKVLDEQIEEVKE